MNNASTVSSPLPLLIAIIIITTIVTAVAIAIFPTNPT